MSDQETGPQPTFDDGFALEALESIVFGNRRALGMPPQEERNVNDQVFIEADAEGELPDLKLSPSDLSSHAISVALATLARSVEIVEDAYRVQGAELTNYMLGFATQVEENEQLEATITFLTNQVENLQTLLDAEEETVQSMKRAALGEGE